MALIKAQKQMNISPTLNYVWFPSLLEVSNFLLEKNIEEDPIDFWN